MVLSEVKHYKFSILSIKTVNIMAFQFRGFFFPLVFDIVGVLCTIDCFIDNFNIKQVING